jgi:prefoldin subunit 5
LRLRSTAYEQQIAELRQQLATLDYLRAEFAELRER